MTENVKPRSSLSINIFVLRVLGVWFPEEEKRTWRSRLYLIYAILVQGSMWFLYMLSECINMLKVFGNIEKMTEVSFLFLTHIAQGFKNYAFFTNSSKMVKFLDELELEIFTPRNNRQRSIIRWAMNRARSDTVILLGMGQITCILWAIFPFIEKNEGPTRLPLSGWFPLDTTISPYFEIIFSYQMLAVTCNAYSNISLDTTATGLFIHICAQIDILKDSLEYMKDFAIESLLKKKGFNTYITDIEQIDEELYTHEELEEEMILTFKNCVKHHEEIIRYAEDIEEIFNKCFLAQFAASVVIICLTLFKLSLLNTILSIEFVSIVLYQACIVFELLLYCWHGNEIILKSSSLSDSAYNSDWYEFSPKFSKGIILLMARSKKPIRATSGKFFMLSLTSFTAILRSSWSYFAVLNSMHEDEEM